MTILQANCPTCSCCTADLCALGRLSVVECRGLTAPDLVEAVYGCPCSAPTTPGTHAWRAERVRVTRLATETPAPPDLEVKLNDLAATGEVTEGDETALARLRVAGLTTVDDAGTHTVTDSGRLYLTARREHRVMTPIEVRSVDTVARTAAVVVIGWRLTEPVTVLMDQLIAEIGPDVERLPGTFLGAEANCAAASADDIVLTKIRTAPSLPAGWVAGDETLELAVCRPGAYVPAAGWPTAPLAVSSTPAAGLVDDVLQSGGDA